ncbi:MAG: MBL fold metallo-hydrolase, partial [Fusobacteriaceae bacterium]
DIFSWREEREIEYIISSDIADALSSKDKNITFVDRDNRDGVALESDAKVYTFGSTDIGVSFLIDTGEKIIFHSGDLNWWDWGDEDSFEESQNMERDFKNILEDLKYFLSDNIIDTAFFPVDPRMEERAYKGALYFIDYIAPKKIVPMHFGDNFEVCAELKRLVGERKTAVANIELDGRVNFQKDKGEL